MAKLGAQPQAAFLLHSRSFTDSRYILELFSQHQGRLKAVYRPVKRKSGVTKPQPFTPLLIDFYGTGELKTLRNLEATGNAILSGGMSLFCGLYLNELLQKLLPLEFDYPELYRAYHAALVRLAHAPQGDEDMPLRGFEFELLAVLGYAINFEADTLGEPIVAGAERFYGYYPQEGFVPQHGSVNPQAVLCHADTLAAIAVRDWCHPQARSLAKQLSRRALHEVLGGKELKSRELFR